MLPSANPYSLRKNGFFYRPKKTGISNNRLFSQYSADSFNCKVKVYNDNSLDYTFKDSFIYGFQTARRCSSDSFYSHFGDSVFNKSEQLKKLHYQHLKVLDIIQSSFDGCEQAFLNAKLQERLNNIPVLDDDERQFLNSLRNSLRIDNFKKTKETLFDYVKSNLWDYFFTGTFDQKRFDSSNAVELKSVLQSWFKNMVYNYHISYIVIFEYHKKGGIHIHGLIRENPLYPLRLVDSGTKTYYGFKKPMKDSTALKRGLDVKKGRTVYNLKTWKFGWSTAIKFYGKPEYVASYVTKYITKDNSKIMGRYFWHSQDLDKPKQFYLNVDYDSLKLPKYHGFKYLYFPGDSPEVQEIISDITKKDKISLSDYQDIYDLSKKDKIRNVEKIREDKKEEFTEWVDLSAPADNDFLQGWVDI